jgi:hypothetical protein
MCEFPTEDVLFGVGEMRNAVESDGILCRESAFPEQVFQVSQAMCPGKLCSIVHELVMGQTGERVRKLGVDVGEVIVNVALLGPLGAVFITGGSPYWTLLLIRAFGRHGRAEGEELQHQEGGAS